MVSLRYPWETEPWETGAEPAQAPLPDPAPKRRGRRPARTDAAAAHWLYHHLTVTGPAGPLAVFAAAARGSGIIPWQIGCCFPMSRRRSRPQRPRRTGSACV